jgi:hypothetical protein
VLVLVQGRGSYTGSSNPGPVRYGLELRLELVALDLM